MRKLYSWWVEFVLRHPLKIPQLWSTSFSGFQLSGSPSPIAALCQPEVRDFWQKAICNMYFSQSPAAGGWRRSCEDPALLAFLPGVKNCLLPNPKWGLEWETIFQKLVHIKYFVEAPTKLLLHFKEGLFIPLVKLARLRQRLFTGVDLFRKDFLCIAPCSTDNKIPPLVASVLFQKMFRCSKEKNKHFRKRSFHRILQNWCE